MFDFLRIPTIAGLSAGFTVSGSCSACTRFTETVQWMSFIAGLPKMVGSKVILPVSDWLKMTWIHTKANSTEMIQFQPFWDKSNHSLIRPPMGTDHLTLTTAKLELTISTFTTRRGGPQPARTPPPYRSVFVDFAPKTLRHCQMVGIPYRDRQFFSPLPPTVVFGA